MENGPTLVTNASDDEKSLVKSQRRWDSGDRVSYGAHIFWMIKEFGWVLLIPEICLPCGALAAVMIAYGVIVHCYRRPLEEVVIEIVMCIWLWNNVLWMASEVLFDEPDVEFPWNFCPVILGEHQSLCYHLSEIFKNGFLLGVAVYVLGVLVIFYRHRQVRGALGEVLLQGYLCSWCLKDYFWAAEKVWPALSAHAALSHPPAVRDQELHRCGLRMDCVGPCQCSLDPWGAGVSGCERLQLRLCQLAFCCSYSADLWLCFLQGS